MFNGYKIILGIFIFVIFFTTPFWCNYVRPDLITKPNLILPTEEKECIRDREYMIANHMDLLNEWRDKVVRQNIRFLEKDGKPLMIKNKRAEMSLTKTCLCCHNNKKDFCDQCHIYLDVSPYCWDCHVDKYEPLDGFMCPEIKIKKKKKKSVEAIEEVK